jgi:hypothetical protein
LRKIHGTGKRFFAALIENLDFLENISTIYLEIGANNRLFRPNIGRSEYGLYFDIAGLVEGLRDVA